ncbi:amidohydrolase [Phenylobacterium sp.]|uniref:amidohydrolase n=1 Tax=Phenylobacterium sp. TaxID=1871053 RepID=UPI0012153C75|nr:amidohydrolase [Phenylobacterium sp.]THD52230.1 MAG: amidohydrolase [Phenylobacterium sp.]
MRWDDRSRRGFLGLAGAGLAAPWARAAAGAASEDADLVVLNAKVLTVDAQAPRAQAFAVRGGRFIAVGRNEDIRPLIGKRTQTFDAQGMTVTPGFIDCHNHAPGETLLYDVLVGNPFEVEFVTIDSIVEKLRARAQTLPPDTWVRGEFYDDIKVKDGRLLNVHDLDRVSTTQPVGVRHRGGHTMFYNSKALAMAGVTKATPDPPGGTYDRGPDGELNGRVTDNASRPIEAIGLRQTFTPQEAARRGRDGQAHMSKQFVRYGLTSVHHEGGDLAALQDIRARGDLKHRVSYEPQALVMEAMIRSGLQTGFGDEWIKLGATSEHLVDGSFSERTMAMSHAYPGVSPPYFGNLTETPEVLNAWIERVHRAGIDVNCHANGDVAIDRVLTAIERAQKLYPRPNARPKITHCTLLNPSLIARIKAASVVPAVFSTYAYYNSDKFPFYGEATIRNAMAFRDLLDAGVPVCAGSDFNPGPFSPLMAIQAMVTRKGWDGKVWGANQRITVDEALRVNTLNGAFASHEETTKGSIAPGKLADYVVLADDPHTVDPDRIKDIKIVHTVTGGATVYQA